VASAFFGIVAFEALEASGSTDAVDPVLADWDVTSVRTDAAAAAVWKGERRRTVSPRGLSLLGLGRG
jgi:hypothetical protein